jgi:NAD(P)-dependent dehydrogenase (short-subunit alcohol dehydrogenase family)
MSGRVAGKVAIVTGAGTRGGGIGNGKASALLYAREGASVVTVDLDRELAEDTARMIEAEGGKAIAVRADVSQASDCEAVVRAACDAFGGVHILHNNVGITESGGPVEYSEAAWERMMSVNVKSMFLMAKYALPVMEAQGTGSIVNIGSINAIRAIPFPKLAYAASKAAVIGLSREIAVQYAPKGIRCNVVLPGLIKAPIVEQNNVALYGGNLERMWEIRDAMCPTGFQGETSDIANTCLFLASDEARYVNGVVIPVDGGLVNLVKL